MLDPSPELKEGPIEIRVVTDYKKFPDSATRCLILLQDNWDDFGYKVTFNAHLFDDNSQAHEIGNMRIAQVGMHPGYVDLKSGPLNELGISYGSLGVESYYENLNAIPESTRNHIYKALRDMAFYPQVWEFFKEQDVTRDALLRGITTRTVTEQYHRIAHGGARLTSFRFNFTPSQLGISEPPRLDFEVDPNNSIPPNNIHVIIGKNGVGKSQTIRSLFQASAAPNQLYDGRYGYFHYGEESPFFSKETSTFRKVVAVSFSAFDNLDSPPDDTDDTKFVKIGLRDVDNSGSSDSNDEQIAISFGKIALECVAPGKLQLWNQAILTLSTDLIFREYGLLKLNEWHQNLMSQADSKLAQKQFINHCAQLFRQLSSGHKIVLLTAASLIWHTEEKALILIDEPETHLHPPLLSSFIRCLSDLLEKKNGVAIVATHSPVVLQEVPMKCVWKLDRAGDELKARRPKLETFGENISVLTDEIFRLELEESGYHKVLKKVTAKHSTYKEALEVFKGQLGSEAKAVLRGLCNNQKDEEVN